MVSGTSPFLFVLVLWLLLFPAGVAIAIKGRKRRTWIIGGIACALLSIPAWAVPAVYGLWKLDAVRGWKLEVPVTAPSYVVTLIQEPGFDLYESYLKITRPDGKTDTVVIDGDDTRWWNPGVVTRDGKIYFTRGIRGVNSRTTYVDVSHDIIFSGYLQRMEKISELKFK
jgi:hypothetical protein